LSRFKPEFLDILNSLLFIRKKIPVSVGSYNLRFQAVYKIYNYNKIIHLSSKTGQQK